MASVEPGPDPDDRQGLPSLTPATRHRLTRLREPFTAGQKGQEQDHGRESRGKSPWADMPPAERFSTGGTGTDETSAEPSHTTEGAEPVGGQPDPPPLLEATRDLAHGTPEGRALETRLEAFYTLDDMARDKAASVIRKDIADIVARAITEEHHRAELLNALATFRNDQTLAASGPAEREEQHPLVAELVDVVEDVLAHLGKEMLIEVLLPGAHVVLPPTDFVDSLLTAAEMIKIADRPVEIEPPVEIEEPADPFWPL